MTVPTITAVYTSLYNDGLLGGTGVTTDATPVSGDYLVLCTMGSSNAETMTAPVGFTEATVPDNLVATAGGQIRVYYLKNPAASTTYVATFSGAGTTRRAAIGLLVHLADGTTFIDVKSSLETAPGATHAGPALTTTGADRLMVSFAGIRQFPPDPNGGWTAPSGWTAKANIIGTDSNNNISLGAAVIAAATAGTVNETWTQADAFEDAIVITFAVVPASTGGGSVSVGDAAGGGAVSGETGPETITTVLNDTSGGGAGAGGRGPEATTVALTDLPGGGAGAGGTSNATTVALSDLPGGGAVSGESGPEAAGSTLGDVPGGGAAGGGTPNGITTVLNDPAGGGAVSGESGPEAAGGSLSDLPGGGAGAGGVGPEGATTVLVDLAGGGAGAGGTGPGATSVGVADLPGGGAAAGGQLEKTAITVSDPAGGGAVSGGTIETTTAGGGSAVTLGDVPGGGAAAGGTIEVPSSSEVVHDTMVMPVLSKALACLTAAAQQGPNAPALYQLRSGNSFVASADAAFDECCAGIAWVRPGVMYPTDDFPQQKSDVGDSVETDWAVQLEIGIQRCIPTQGDDGVDGSVVTTTQWAATVQQEMDDGASLRRAACCLRDQYVYPNGLKPGNSGLIIGVQTPMENSGPCGGVMLVLTVRVPACDCVDI